METGVSFTCIANVVNWAMDWHPGVEAVLCLVFVTDSCTLASGINVSGILSHQLMGLGEKSLLCRDKDGADLCFGQGSSVGKVWPSVEPVQMHFLN